MRGERDERIGAGLRIRERIGAGLRIRDRIADSFEWVIRNR
jgi:hypothetical protein